MGPALALGAPISASDTPENNALPKEHALTRLHMSCILIHMRTTLNIDDRLLDEARRLSGIKEKTALVRVGLEALIARESAKRLAALGATEKPLRRVRRRRTRRAS